jgi:hypothetical protein
VLKIPPDVDVGEEGDGVDEDGQESRERVFESWGDPLQGDRSEEIADGAEENLMIGGEEGEEREAKSQSDTATGHQKKLGMLLLLGVWSFFRWAQK